MRLNSAEHLRLGKSSSASSYTQRTALGRTDMSERLVLLLVAPFLTAAVLLILVPGTGLMDRWIATPVQFRTMSFVNFSDAPPKVLKASLPAPSVSSGPGELVHTRYRVVKGDSLSKLAYTFELTPATLISVNHLENPDLLKPGRILVIPYTDGTRVSPGAGEGAAEVAARFAVNLSELRRIPAPADPGGRDFFLPGVVLDPPGEVKDGFFFPVAGRILTPFGETKDILTGIPYRNDGLDLAAPPGSPVFVTQDGTVSALGHHPYYGRYVVVAHSGVWTSLYGYLGSVSVSKGDRLQKGAVIGNAGDSGSARSSGLHFVLMRSGEAVDPLDYLW